MHTIRFGLIGYGAWGAHHARAMKTCDRARLAAIAVRSEASQARARTEHPEAAVTGDYRALLARDDVDAVDIVLPSHLHVETALAALEAGKHVLLEKPMALDVRDCDRLIAAAESRGLVLAVGHELRLSSLWGQVRDLIDAGAIGTPRYVLIELWRKPYRPGADGWRYDLDRVGNWILEEPIHFFDLARWYLSSCGEPESVYAVSSAKRADRPELEDNFSATLRFPGGAYAVISQSLAGWEHHQIAKVTGTAGAVWAAWSGALDRTFHPTYSLRLQRDGGEVEELPVPRIPGEVYELEDEIARFVAAVAGETRPAADGRDGRWSVALCAAAAESARSGAVVRLDGRT